MRVSLKRPSPCFSTSLCVIEGGAYADLLLEEENPTRDATILADYENKIGLIMKDAVIYKNTFR